MAQTEYQRQYYLKNQEKIKSGKRKEYKENEKTRQRKLEYQREWRKKNPEKRREGQRRYRKNNKEKIQSYKTLYKQKLRLKLNKYGLCLLDYYVGLSLGCEICGREFSEGRKKSGICLDHDHSTGRFRGFLCGGCNSMLGFAADDTKKLTKAIRFLENSVSRR